MFRTTAVRIGVPPDMAKRPRLDPNGNNINKSFDRYESYKMSRTSAEFFQKHAGTTREAEQDFFNDVKKGIIVIEDKTYINLLFMFAPEFDDRVYLSEISVGLEAEIAAFHDHVMLDKKGAGDVTIPLHDLLERMAQFGYLADILEHRGTHDTGDYLLRVNELADHIRAATHCSDLLNESTNDCSDEIMMHLVDSENYEVIIDETKIASLKGLTGDMRENMIKAISKEVIGIMDISTFELCILPQNRREIPTKLVLKVKYRADGEYDKHKARMVVQGFHQVPDRDFHATFAPMASFVNVRLVMSIAVQHGWALKHADVPQAFLRSSMDTDVYIRLAKGIALRDRTTAVTRSPMARRSNFYEHCTD